MTDAQAAISVARETSAALQAEITTHLHAVTFAQAAVSALLDTACLVDAAIEVERSTGLNVQASVVLTGATQQVAVEAYVEALLHAEAYADAAITVDLTATANLEGYIFGQVVDRLIAAQLEAHIANVAPTRRFPVGAPTGRGGIKGVFKHGGGLDG